MENLSTLKKDELIFELRKYKLPTTGSKSLLKSRLRDFLASRPVVDETYTANEMDTSANIDERIREKERELAALRSMQLNSTVLQDRTQQSIRSSPANHHHEVSVQVNETRASQVTSAHSNQRMERSDLPYSQPNQFAMPEARPMQIQRERDHNEMYSQPNQFAMPDTRPMQIQRERDYNEMYAQQPTYDPYANVAVRRSMLHYKDIEGSMNTFTGDDNYRVEVWIEDFEQNAALFRMTPFDKMIIAKKLLRGPAKLLLRSLFVSTWEELKSALINEFGLKVSSKEAHNLLKTTKKLNNQSMRDYVLRMREIGITNGVDKESIIQYIIDGINDSQANKVILFGAKTFEELNEKLEVYTKYRNINPLKKEPNKSNDAKKTPKEEKVEGNRSSQRCFMCGEENHRMTDCPTKDKGFKCYRCGEFGHRANENICSKKDEKSMMCIKSKERSMKEVRIGGLTVHALIDTGSDINAVRKSFFAKLQIPSSSGKMRNLKGAGGGCIKVDRYFREKIVVDDEEFESTFFILNDNEVPYDVIIGNELLHDNVLIMKNGEISIKKNEKEEGEEETTEENQLMSITVDTVNELPPKIQNLIDQYKPNKTNKSEIELKLQLEDDTPVVRRPRRLSYHEKQIVEKQIKEWISEGVVKPGNSQYASTVTLAKKKDNSDRVCLDFRAVNKKIVKDRYPLPLIEDVLDALQGARVFSTIDLKNGFFHVPVEKESQKYLSFVTHSGQYICLKTPFGCCNSPAVFQRYINEVFRELINEGIVLVYMDDVIIVAKDEEEAMERLKRTLDCAASAGLDIKWKKCQFLQKTVEFLGHIIEDGVIKPSQLKIKAVQRFKEPQTIKQIQSFLGLTGYFRKFIRGYANIARPLTDLLRKGVNFTFNKDERRAFETLKGMLMGDPVLKIFQREAETQLFTDASKYGLGAILMQKDATDNQFHPVYFSSTKTSAAEERYDSYTLEVLAIVKALEKFRSYLLGKKFTIVTDCEAFKKTMEKKDIVSRVARWVMYMQNFDYEIEHRGNSQMRHVDALSRMFVIVSKEDDLCIKVRQLQRNDDEVKQMVSKVQEKPYDDYFLRNGVLYKAANGYELLVVPEAMEGEIIRSAHANGHFGIKKMVENINQQFYIRGVNEKSKRIVDNCVSCILAERKHGKGEGFLHSIQKGEHPLDTYHIDHLGPMVATCKLYKHLFVVVDAFSKFVWIYPTKTTNAKEALDKLRMQQCVFGNPRRIISDKGAAFTSDDFKKYCEDESIDHVFTTTGMPRANGQVERINRSIIAVLTKMAIDDPTKWFKFVVPLQHTLNSTHHRSIASTPFRLMFGVEMRQKPQVNLVEALEESFIEQFQAKRAEARLDAKHQIQKIQNENKQTFDKKRKAAKSYTVNELVAIKRTQFVNGNKLAEHFFGPYKVTNKKANERYDVEKVGNHSGPNITSTSAEYMKKWFSSGAEK